MGSDDVQETRPLRRTESQAVSDAVKAATPAATAGMGGIPAPPVMKGWQLQEQANALMGGEVVLTVIPPEHGAVALAGKLTAGAREGTWVLYRSSCYNENEGVAQMTGRDETLELPMAGWRYLRLVSLAVHQTEAARRECARLAEKAQKTEEGAKGMMERGQQQLDEKDAKVARVENEIALLREMIQGMQRNKEERSEADRQQPQQSLPTWDSPAPEARQTPPPAGPSYNSAPPPAPQYFHHHAHHHHHHHHHHHDTQPAPHWAPPYSQVPPAPQYPYSQPQAGPRHDVDPMANPTQISDVVEWGPWLCRGRAGVMELQYMIEKEMVQPFISKPGVHGLTKAWAMVSAWMHMAASFPPGEERVRPVGNLAWAEFLEAHAYTSHGISRATLHAHMTAKTERDIHPYTRAVASALLQGGGRGQGGRGRSQQAHHGPSARGSGKGQAGAPRK